MNKLLLLAGSLCFGAIVNAQQVPNGTLETWTPSGLGYDDPDGFQTLNFFTFFGAPVSCEKTTSAHGGTYAAQITAVQVDFMDGSGPQTIPGVMSLSADGTATGIPYTASPDSVVFWYKYAPQNSDQGAAIINLTSGGNDVATGQFMFTTAQSTYKRASVAFDYSSSTTPDTLKIGFVTGAGAPQNGSVLTIDDIQLVFNAGAGLSNYYSIKQVGAFPNPANESVNIAIANGQTLSVYSSTGQLLETLTTTSNGQNTTINTRNYAEGIYLIKGEDGSAARFVVKH